MKWTPQKQSAIMKWSANNISRYLAIAIKREVAAILIAIVDTAFDNRRDF